MKWIRRDEGSCHHVCHVIDPGTVFHERINAEYRGKTRRDADNRPQNSENEMPAQASFNARPHSQQKYTYYQSVNDKVHITDPLYYSYIYYSYIYFIIINIFPIVNTISEILPPIFYFSPNFGDKCPFGRQNTTENQQKITSAVYNCL